MRSVFLQLKSKDIQQRGFSLIELLITIGIMIMVTGAVLIKYTSFDHTTLLKSQALEISLDIRAAQQYGVSARADRTDTHAAYGVYFDAQTPNQYQLFLDADDNNLYDNGEEVGVAQVLDNRFTISEICVQSSCSNSRAVSVAFKRPNFDAVIGNSNSSGGAYGLHDQTQIEIILTSVSDPSITRSVLVYQSGQIAVQ